MVQMLLFVPWLWRTKKDFCILMFYFFFGLYQGHGFAIGHEWSGLVLAFSIDPPWYWCKYNYTSSICPNNLYDAKKTPCFIYLCILYTTFYFCPTDTNSTGTYFQIYVIVLELFSTLSCTILKFFSIKKRLYHASHVQSDINRVL